MAAPASPESQRAVRWCGLAIEAIGLLVPRVVREAWRREWHAELAHHVRRLERVPVSPRRARADLARRAMGALPDALWLRQQFTLDAELITDARYGARLLRANLAFALASILLLAIGVGASTALFTVAYQAFLRSLPYRDADRVVTLWQTRLFEAGAVEDVSPANFVDWRERARSFDVVAAGDPFSYDYTSGSEPEVLFATRVTEGFFEALGVTAQLGRTFERQDYVPGHGDVVVLTHSLWLTRFGGNRGIVGRTLQLDGEPYEVVGVLPAGVDPAVLPSPGERGLYAPKVVDEDERMIRASPWWNVVARLRPGITIQAAQAEMATIARDLAREYPRTNSRTGARVVPLREHLLGDAGAGVVAVGAAAGGLLLIACANLATLTLARSARRWREVGIRAALGASRARIARQLLGEAALVAVLGSLAGITVARWSLKLLAASAPLRGPAGDVLRLDWLAFVFAAALCAFTTLAFGLAPALRLSRCGADAMLREGSRTATSGRRERRFRAALVVGEVALALALVGGATLLTHSLARLVSVDPGFRRDNVVVLQVFAWDRHPKAEQRAEFFRQALARIEALPGVKAAGAVSAMPFIEANINIKGALAIEGEPPLPAESQPTVFVTIATTRYFEVMGIPLLAGRTFGVDDNARGTPVAVVTETLARRYFGAGDPIGRRITVSWSGQPRTALVVGTVGAVRHDGLDQAPRPEVFIPHAQVPYGSMTFVIRRASPDIPGLDALKHCIRVLDPLQTFYRTATLGDLVDRTLTGRRFTVRVLGSFALLALLLATIGLYAVISLSIAERRQEFGIRLAIGARPSSLACDVVLDSLRLSLVGGGLGLFAFMSAASLARRFLFGVSPADPLVIIALLGTVLGVALLASVLAARHLTRVNPVEALQGTS